MTIKHSHQLLVSLITVSALASCGGNTHELGEAPDAASPGAGSTSVSSAVGGNGGSSAMDAAVAGSAGGSSTQGGATSPDGTTAQGGKTASGGATGAGGVGGSSTASSMCCNALYCPSGYSLIGPSGSATCPAGFDCSTFVACGCNQVLCARAPDGGAIAGGGGSGSGGMGGSGGATKTGGASGSSCTAALSCNWCSGESVKDANGCVTGYRCANGVDPCKTSSCSAFAPCPDGQTCSNMLCWSNDGGAGDTGGTDGSGGSGGSSGSSCPRLPSCNWCAGEEIHDASGCVTGWRCANGVDPCKTSSCSASNPCGVGQTCRNLLCWPNDGGTGSDGR